jgi:hypothetical protein
MLNTLARGCPPGPFPGWCDATWVTLDPYAPGDVQGCQPSPLPAGAAGPQIRSGVCYSFGPRAASWWTLPHIAALFALAVVVAVIIGLGAALTRDNFRASRAARR